MIHAGIMFYPLSTLNVGIHVGKYFLHEHLEYF